MNRNGNSEPAKTGPVPLEANAGDRRRLHDRPSHQNADCQQGDGADLHERRQVVARRQQQPDRQHRGGKTVDDDAPRQRHLGEREPVHAPGGFGNPAAGDHGQQQQHDADERYLRHPARSQESQVQTHEQGDRDGHRDGEHAPGALGEGVDDDEREDRQQDHHDHQHADDRGDATDRAQLVAGHLAERAAAAPDRDGQHQVVLHATRDQRADDDPDGAGQVAHLHGEHRPDQWTGAGDRREVMTEQHPSIGRHVVGAVVEHLCRGGLVVAGLDDLHLDEAGVEPVSDDVGAHRGDDEPDGADRLPAEEGDDRPGHRAEQCDDGEDDLVLGGDR